jgi:hypothetical protein
LAITDSVFFRSPFVYSIKLKLEFIVLNQLQTLVKRGMTPGLGRLGSELSVSDSRGDDPSPPVTFAASKGKSLPVFDRGFITKAGAATVPSLGVSSVTDSLESEREKLGNKKHCSCQKSQEGEEHDLKNVVGRPDDSVKAGVDDIERQYLGRWDGSSKG